MTADDIMVSLFAYETGGTQLSELSNYLHLFSKASGQSGKMLDEAFAEWKKSKRPIKQDEVNETWLKKGNNGLSFLLTFYPDGTLLEQNYGGNSHSDHKPCWQGNWELINGVLKTSISKYEVHYFTEKKPGKYSGIEYAEGCTPNAYYTLKPYDISSAL